MALRKNPIAWATAQITKPDKDYRALCLQFTRMAFDIPAKYPDAKSAWANAKKKHKTSSAKNIPAGVPVFWETRSKWDHVALSIGGGKCISTDIKRRGKVDVVNIDTVTKSWGPLLGWSEDLNGVTVYTPKASGGAGSSEPPAVTKGKTISLSELRNAALTDPKRSDQKTTNWAAVKPVEDALVAKGYLPKALADGHFGTQTKIAYRLWQRALGYTGKDSDGLPGMTSLKRLMEPLGYTIVG